MKKLEIPPAPEPRDRPPDVQADRSESASATPSADILPLPASRIRRAQRRPPARAKVKVEDHISRQLRALYDDVVSQPIPDRLVDLLRQLETGNGAPKRDDG